MFHKSCIFLKKNWLPQKVHLAYNFVFQKYIFLEGARCLKEVNIDLGGHSM